MRKLLDTLFSNKKASIIIPLGISLLLYMLFLLFNDSPDKNDLILIIPIVSIIGFFGVFLVFFVQVKNNSCPEWFLNIFEMLAIIIFGIGTIVSIISFFISGFQDFSPILCLGTITWSSISWAHNKRKKDNKEIKKT